MVIFFSSKSEMSRTRASSPSVPQATLSDFLSFLFRVTGKESYSLFSVRFTQTELVFVAPASHSLLPYFPGGRLELAYVGRHGVQPVNKVLDTHTETHSVLVLQLVVMKTECKCLFFVENKFIFRFVSSACDQEGQGLGMFECSE